MQHPWPRRFTRALPNSQGADTGGHMLLYCSVAATHTHTPHITHTHHTHIHANTLTNTPYTYTKIHIHIYTHKYTNTPQHIYTYPTCHTLHTYTLYTCTLHPPHVLHIYTHTHHCKVLLSLVKQAGSIWGTQGTPMARFPPCKVLGAWESTFPG